MRQIILDTETTGISPKQGHRIIEIGCVELVNRKLTGNNFHYYLQPDRPSDPNAIRVHGITDEFLVGKPRFPEIIDEFIEYVTGSEIIIHNAPFDVGFINAEFRRIKEYRQQNLEDLAAIIDTLLMARELHPGQRNSLDALCKRYKVDNSNRTLHGALLDSEILAEVYLQMTGGQTDLALGAETEAKTDQETAADAELPAVTVIEAPVVMANADELAAHEKYMTELTS